jgi:hypothetical protein
VKIKPRLNKNEDFLTSRGGYLDMGWSEKIVYNSNGEVVF